MRIRIPLIFTLISLLSSGCATFDPDPIAADQSVTPDEITGYHRWRYRPPQRRKSWSGSVSLPRGTRTEHPSLAKATR